MWWTLALAALVLLWNTVPVLMLCALPIPARHKLRGSISLLRAAARGLLILPADLLAPVVADEEFAQRYYPNRWRVVPESVPLEPQPEEPQ